MKNRETFNFYRSFYEAGKSMADDERIAFYDAILMSSFEDETPVLEGLADIVFTAIKPVIDNQTSNYINGKKGGRPAKNNPPLSAKNNPPFGNKKSYKEKEKEKEKESIKRVSLLIPKSFNGFKYPKGFSNLWEMYNEGTKSEAYKAYIKLAEIKNNEILLKEEYKKPITKILEVENTKSEYKRHLSTILRLDLLSEYEKHKVEVIDYTKISIGSV